MSELQELYSPTQIIAGVKKIADAIIKRETMMPQVFIPIMSAAMPFASDLLQALYPEVNPIVWPVKVTRVPSEKIKDHFISIVYAPSLLPKGGLNDKRVLVIDTIYDTGSTALAIDQFIRSKSQPRSVEVASLVWRNDPRAGRKPTFYAFDMNGASHFIFGYGMDRDQKDRGMPRICYERK